MKKKTELEDHEMTGVVGNKIYTSDYIIELTKDWDHYKKGSRISCLKDRANQLIQDGFGKLIGQDILKMGED